ncbi:hypothetical protein J7K74_02420 [Candidatus Woesearchaeota archaeon]|nr:hypothetical protein [Candidatus Woesearchaeota archaeon]
MNIKDKIRILKIKKIIGIALIVLVFLILLSIPWKRGGTVIEKKFNISKTELFIYNTGTRSYYVSIEETNPSRESAIIVVGEFGSGRSRMEIRKGTPISIYGLKLEIINIYNDSILLGITGSGKADKSIRIKERYKYLLETGKKYVLEPLDITLLIKQRENDTILVIWPDSIKSKEVGIEKGLYRIETSTSKKEVVIYALVENISNKGVLSMFRVFVKGDRSIFPFKEPVVLYRNESIIALSSNGIAALRVNGSLIGLSLLEKRDDSVIVEMYKYRDKWINNGLIFIGYNYSMPMDIGYRFYGSMNNIVLLRKQ